MRISILCSDAAHPVNPYLERWRRQHQLSHTVDVVRRSSELPGGEFLFLVSCTELIDQTIRSKYRYSLVIHGSDLPKGRGWSPVVWQILEGKNRIAVTLLEAVDKVDAGPVWHKEIVDLEGHELIGEINEKIFSAELRLMDYAVANAATVKAVAQNEGEATSYPRRCPQDSRLDPERSLAAQFELLRVADPDRYPAFFDLRGHRYILRIEKHRLTD